jgi:hypothetical protein
VHRALGVLARDPSIPIFARSEEGGKQRIDTKPQNCWDGRFAYHSQGLFMSLKLTERATQAASQKIPLAILKNRIMFRMPEPFKEEPRSNAQTGCMTGAPVQS